MMRMPTAISGLRIMACLSLALMVLACTPQNTDTQRSRILRIADSQPEGYPTVEALREFSRIVGQESGGRLRGKIYPGRQLGEEIDTLEQTAFGAIDIDRINANVLNSIAPKTVLLTLPFIFRSPGHRDRVLRGPVGEEILASLEDYGIVGLAFYDSGARSFYTNIRPILSPDDMKGMRIRVQNSDVGIAMIDALGGNPTPMEFGQVYEALRNGTIDGAENNWPSFADTRHYETTKFYSLTEHSMTPEVLVISKLTWDKLSAKDQALMRRAASASAQRMSELWAARVEASRRIVEQHGNEIVEVPDKQPFIDAMAPLYAAYEKDADLARLIAEAKATP